MGFTARYRRFDRLLQDMGHARGDGRDAKLLVLIAETDVLCRNFLLAPPSDVARRDLPESLDDGYGPRSTIVTSQLPVKHWREAIGDPTLADAILDRLAHNSYRIDLKSLLDVRSDAVGLTGDATE